MAAALVLGGGRQDGRAEGGARPRCQRGDACDRARRALAWGRESGAEACREFVHPREPRALARCPRSTCP